MHYGNPTLVVSAVIPAQICCTCHHDVHHCCISCRPAVANGTYRELQHDDYVTGPNGEQVGRWRVDGEV